MVDRGVLHNVFVESTEGESSTTDVMFDSTENEGKSLFVTCCWRAFFPLLKPNCPSTTGENKTQTN